MELDKKYYRIKDVSEMLGVPPSTLRFWETEFPLIKPHRSVGNMRYYSPADIENLRKIKFLIYDRGLKTSAARQQLRSNPSNVSKRVQIIERLEGIKDELQKLLDALKIRK